MRKGLYLIAAGMLLLLLTPAIHQASGTEVFFLRGMTFGAMQWPSFDEELVLYNLARLVDLATASF